MWILIRNMPIGLDDGEVKIASPSTQSMAESVLSHFLCFLLIICLKAMPIDCLKLFFSFHCGNQSYATTTGYPQTSEVFIYWNKMIVLQDGEEE